MVRALSIDPIRMLFDEPTLALDPETVSEILNVIAGLAKDGTRRVGVAHESGVDREVADRVISWTRT